MVQSEVIHKEVDKSFEERVDQLENMVANMEVRQNAVNEACYGKVPSWDQFEKLCQMVVDVMKEVKAIRVDMDLLKASTANHFKGRGNGRGGGHNGHNGTIGGFNKQFSGNVNGQGGFNGNTGMQSSYPNKWFIKVGIKVKRVFKDEVCA